ncbi:MAG: hypothetical protein ABI270_03995 [Nitrosospira sp.]
MILVTAIIPGITKNLRSMYVAACMVGFLILPGCASFQITIPDSDPIKPKGYTEGYLKKTMHAFFWGLVLDPQVLSAECNAQGINDVIIYRTLAHDFAGVITLGIWMPTEVYYRCKAPPTRPGVLPSPSKRSKSRQLS